VITSSQNKLKYFIIFLAVLVLIFGGIIGWTLFQKSKLLPKEEVIPEEVVSEEMYSLTGIVSKVNVENNFLMVRPTGQENEVKVIISEDIKLLKVVYPSERGNPAFKTERVEITIKDIEEGDRVFIKTKINIAGMKEFDDIDYIEVL